MTDQAPHSRAQQPHTTINPAAPALSEPADTGLMPRIEGKVMSGQDILRLQRLIGNQRTQRICASPAAPQTISPRIQRAKAHDPMKEDNGLMEKGTPQRFADTMNDYIRNPDNADKNVEELEGFTKESLNAELAIVGVPSIDLHFEAGDELLGSFYYVDWDITFHPNVVFDETTRVGDLSEDQVKLAIDTLYHEVRHAEQFFRIVQLNVTPLLKETQDPTTILTQLGENFKDMPLRIIEKAIENPLDANTSRQIVREIRMWDRSRFGADKTYRVLMEHRIEADLLKPIDESTQDFLDLMPEEYKELDETELEKLARAKIIVEDRLIEIEQFRKNALQAELERIQDVEGGKLQKNNDLMISHLRTLIGLVNKLRAYQPLPSEPYAAAVKMYDVRAGVREIRTEVLQAYNDLPLETDANEAGRQAGDTLNP